MKCTGYKYTHPNPLIALMAKQPPKDYRQRLWQRELASATEPTLTPTELMERIRTYKQPEGGWQKRIRIQSPADSEACATVFFTTHPESLVRINGIPANRKVYQNVTLWCMQAETLIYLNGDQISWQDLPTLIRRHGAQTLLEPVPVTVISNTSDVLEHLFGQDSEDIREAKSLISHSMYLENAAGKDPYDISDCF